MSARDKIIQRVIDENTFFKPCVIGGQDKVEFTVWFKVDQQSFCVTPHTAENMEEVAFYRKMIATAVVQLFENIAEPTYTP